MRALSSTAATALAGAPVAITPITPLCIATMAVLKQVGQSSFSVQRTPCTSSVRGSHNHQSLYSATAVHFLSVRHQPLGLFLLKHRHRIFSVCNNLCIAGLSACMKDSGSS